MVYLVFRTDKWHSIESRELVYVGDDLESSIAQIEAHSDCTPAQAEQLREYAQSQCNDDVDYEWDILGTEINEFV